MKTDQKLATPESTLNFLSYVGLLLREARVARQMTHEEVVNACGFSRQTVSRIEKGDPSVSVGQVARYAELLGLTSAMPVMELPDNAAIRRVRRRKTAATNSLIQ